MARTVTAAAIREAAIQLVGQAATRLPADVVKALRRAARGEKNAKAKFLLKMILLNAAEAERLGRPLCQDTGVQVFLVEQGSNAVIKGDLTQALTKAVAEATKRYGLRSSVVAQPASKRTNNGGNTPPVIMHEIVPGNRLKITLLPKGGGAENKSRLAMLHPNDGWDGVREFVVETVKAAGGDACPPLVIGVGVGGDFDRAAYLAKRALFRALDEKTADKEIRREEKKLLEKINTLGIGPFGMGGKKTALAVHLLVEPCHIASLPVAVNINCHAARRATVIL